MMATLDVEIGDPLELFDSWFQQAEALELNDPNAVALATCTPDGVPSVRMVLAKRTGEERFCFFTNALSRKGGELAANPKAAMCFHWKSLRRQVRVEGTITELSAAESDAYFQSRARRSQVGASVSRQSQELGSRAELETLVREFEMEHTGELPRPSHWGGYCLHPNRIEFWLDGDNRLHDRFLFRLTGKGWQKVRLYP